MGRTRGGALSRLEAAEVLAGYSRVRAHEYPDGGLAVFSGRRRLADDDRKGQSIEGERKEAA